MTITYRLEQATGAMGAWITEQLDAERLAYLRELEACGLAEIR